MILPARCVPIVSGGSALFRTFAVCTLLAELSLAGAQQPGACAPQWQSTFGEAPGTNGQVVALKAWDDGGGVELFAAGRFTTAGGALVSNLASWDGARWTDVGGGTDDLIAELEVFDSGNGPELYVGGYFNSVGGVPASRIAKWDGSSWSALGSGVEGHGSSVQSMLVFDDGTGPALYVAGRFEVAGGVPRNGVAKWDGSAWASVGNGLEKGVSQLLVFDDGNGDRLYACGSFDFGGGTSFNGLARWNGSNWDPAGGTECEAAYVAAVFDDGTGPELIVRGRITLPGASSESRMAKWDGTTWTGFGGGIVQGNVWSMDAYDDGSGPALFVGGEVLDLPGISQHQGVAKWDGSSWSVLGDSTSSGVNALEAFDDGHGVALYIGGRFQTQDNLTTSRIARWDGLEWSALSSGIDREVNALQVYDDGTGPALYAAGRMRYLGPLNNAFHIARWDGTSWSRLGTPTVSPFVGVPETLAVFDEGSGDALFVGGLLHPNAATGGQARHIFRWDGLNWSSVGTGLNNEVRSLAVFDDGNGQALYAGGEFTLADTTPVDRIARWDGTNWSAVGGGMDQDVRALAIFDDGTGTALYAGGDFTTAGSITAKYIAKWDGTSWSPLGSGLSAPVRTLAVFDDGTGPRLYAGSQLAIDGNPLRAITRWDGANWTSVGGGIEGSVLTLTVFDDGSGDALYAGGHFATAGGVAAQNLAKWDGANWTPLGSGVNAQVQALTTFDDGGGTALYVGGEFESAIDSADSYLAKWGCVPTLALDLCNGDGGNQLGCTACPCVNESPQGTIGGCLNSAGTSSRLEASGSSSVSMPAGSSVDLRIAMSNAPALATSLLFSGAGVAPTNSANPCFGLRTGVQAPDRDGLRCAVQAIARHGQRQTSATGAISDATGPHRVWGGEASPVAGLAMQAAFVAGQTRYFQAVHRDEPTGGCMRGLNSSQALQVTFTP